MTDHLAPPSAVAWVILTLLVLVLAVLLGSYRQKRRQTEDTHELLKIAKEWVARGSQTLEKVEQAVARDPDARTRSGDSDADRTPTPPLPADPASQPPLFGPFPRPEDYHP